MTAPLRRLPLPEPGRWSAPPAQPQTWDLNAVGQLVLANSPASAQLCLERTASGNIFTTQPCDTTQATQARTGYLFSAC